ncbi:MAG: phosphate ABC transporter permease subunit PstC [Promethearchaeota archaeon]
MTETENLQTENENTPEKASLFQKLRKDLGKPIADFLTADRSGKTDKLGKLFLLFPALASIFIIILILAFLLFESTPILTDPTAGPGIIVSPVWDPNQNLFGLAIFIVGSLMCTAIAIGIAVPIGIGGALFLSEFCPMWLRQPIKMIVEMMAAIPSIVYGLWAYLVMVPYIRDVLAPSLQTNPLTAWMPWFQGDTNGLSLFAGGLILAIMLLPTVVAITHDSLQSVPSSLREASLALGATQSETARKIVISAALPGVGAAVVLALGRAVGETMAVLMVTGNSLQIPFTLFDPTYVMTSIITNQLGYAFVFPLWRSALFTVGLVLMIMSVCFTLTAKAFIRYGMKTRGYI